MVSPNAASIASYLLDCTVCILILRSVSFSSWTLSVGRSPPFGAALALTLKLPIYRCVKFPPNINSSSYGRPALRDDGWWSDEDAVFVVDVPELAGCMAHGSTRAEAIASAEEAVAFWLQTAKEDGTAIPAPRGRLVVA